jgi:hypothetical protein
MMDQMIAVCGLFCDRCDAFIATLNDDDEIRAELARLWSMRNHHDIELADINCLGCISDSDCLFDRCKVCQIRKCAKEKQFENCAYCDDYACEKLEDFFQANPDARKHLDAIRDTR